MPSGTKCQQLRGSNDVSIFHFGSVQLIRQGVAQLEKHIQKWEENKKAWEAKKILNAYEVMRNSFTQMLKVKAHVTL